MVSPGLPTYIFSFPSCQPVLNVTLRQVATLSAFISSIISVSHSNGQQHFASCPDTLPRRWFAVGPGRRSTASALLLREIRARKRDYFFFIPARYPPVCFSFSPLAGFSAALLLHHGLSLLGSAPQPAQIRRAMVRCHPVLVLRHISDHSAAGSYGTIPSTSATRPRSRLLSRPASNTLSSQAGASRPSFRSSTRSC